MIVECWRGRQHQHGGLAGFGTMLKSSSTLLNFLLRNLGLIDKEHQGNGLSRPMLKILCEQVQSKYGYLYSSISKQNSKAYKVHTKEGWFVVDENDNFHYVLLDPKTVLCNLNL